jgi:hypothetical protein
MTLKETLPETTNWSDETIVDLVRKVRNDLIKDFLDDRYLLEYLGSRFRIHELSRLKTEFIRNDLKELLITPVNIAHYEPLIRQIRETDSASISAGNENLFYREIESILKKYIY